MPAALGQILGETEVNSLEDVIKGARSLGTRLVGTDAFTLVAAVVTIVAG